MRRTYIRFYAAAPLVLTTPRICIAVAHDAAVANKLAITLPLLASAGIGSALWLASAYRSRLEVRAASSDADRDLPDAKQWHTGEAPDRLGEVPDRLQWREWLTVFACAFVTVVFGAAMVLVVSSVRYFGAVLAWLVSLLVALLVVWLRGQVGDRYRRRNDTKPGASLIVMSWAATSLLVVPGVLAIAAAWPLEEATVCTKGTAPRSYDTAGRFIGETKDRVYIGYGRSGRIISIPSFEIARLLIGDDAAHTALCRRTADGPR